VSGFKEIDVTCTECGATGPYTAWDSVDATDQRQKERLLTGKLMLFLCEACGWDAFVIHPLLYHDPQKRFMLYLWTGPGDLNKIMPVEPFSSKYRYRTVGSVLALIEKIRLFDANLDDRVIELLKLKLYDDLRIQKPDAQPEFLFSSVQRAENGLEELRFDFKHGDQDLQMAVPLDIYKELEPVLRPVYRNVLPGMWDRVDSAFAKKLRAWCKQNGSD
jgi:CpXC protein